MNQAEISEKTLLKQRFRHLLKTLQKEPKTPAEAAVINVKTV